LRHLAFKFTRSRDIDVPWRVDPPSTTPGAEHKARRQDDVRPCSADDLLRGHCQPSRGSAGELRVERAESNADKTGQVSPTSLDDRGPCEGYVLTDRARLYYRTMGEGRPIIVLHGGPDFDHHYLLPEMDRLAESFHLIYYDQRGRGRSAGEVEPAEVSIASELEDLDGVRRHFGLDSVAVLGHSWGGVLAMEYAARHPDRVSHLILVDTAPASAEDWLVFRQYLLSRRAAGDVERMQALASSSRYQAGDLEVEAEYYRIHFRVTLREPERLEQLIGRLRAHFTEESVLTARAIEQRLYDETWRSDGYDLLTKLEAFVGPGLVLRGEHDFVPIAAAARIAKAMPRGRLAVLKRCGHFAYLEAPEVVHEHVAALFESS
jgi:proline iminopeptidase